MTTQIMVNARFITLIAKKFNYKILEIDIEHFSREKGKSSTTYLIE